MALEKIPFLDDDEDEGAPDPSVPLNVPFLSQPAQSPALAQPTAAAPPSIPMIGDETPLGRFAQPILPAPPSPPAAETFGQADRDNERQRLEEDRSQLLKPHLGQPGSAHPGWGGKILHGLAVAGNIAGDFADPNLMAQIRGTDANNAIRMHQDNKGIDQLDKDDLGDAAEQAGLQKSKEDLLEAPTKAADAHNTALSTEGNLDSETYAREHPQSSWKSIAGFTGPNGEPLEIDEKTGNTRIATGAPGAKPTAKPGNPQQETYDSLIQSGMTPIQAYKKIREKQPGTSNVGTWTIDEDKDGKPIMFNSKTGETRDAPGVQKAGTKAKADAAVAPVKQALDYANEYVPRTLHTGPGDEALMEKFFELAKPSTGFRMSQQQMDMLKNAQSWMGGLEAHLRHATTGTWFSDDQRKQIGETMNDLGKAKGLGTESSAPTGGAEGGAKPDYVYVPGKGLVKQ